MPSSEKITFSFKQFLSAITIALTIGGGIVRYEYTQRSLSDKIDLLSEQITDKIKSNQQRIEKLEKKTEDLDTRLNAVTTSLTAMLRPEDVTIRRKK